MEAFERERDLALHVLASEKRSDVREQAAAALERLFSDDARRDEGAALVATLVDDRHGPVRRRGVALGARCLPDGELPAFLAARLSDPYDGVRIEAAGQLADLARPELRPQLAVALQDAAFPVRFEAARGMAAIRHPSGLEVLIAALERDDLRFRALGAIGELEDPAAVPALQRLFQRWLLPAFERTQTAGVLARLGDPEGGKHLLERTRPRRWALDRALAIELCGEVKVEGAFERLAEILADGKDDARGAAARGLGRLKDPRGLLPLSALLAEAGADDELRLDAAEGLWLLGLPEARAEVERALPQFHSADARAALLELIEDHP